MRNIGIILIIVTLFTACGNISKQEHLSKKFGIENEDSLVKISEIIPINDSCTTINVPEFDASIANVLLLDDIFDSLYYVNLETDADFVVGEISKIDIVNDTLYILDRKTKTIFTFSLDGKIVQRIGKEGNGPGEYVEPTSMSISQNYIFVYDQWQQKVIKYNHMGAVVADYRLPFLCQKVLMLDNGDMLCFGCGVDNQHLPKILDYCFWQCDSVFRKISKVGLFSENSTTIQNGNIPLDHYNGCYYYFHDKTNDFYQISPNGIINHLVHVKFNPDYPEDFYTNIDFRLNEMKENGAVAVSKFFVTNKYFVYELSGWGYPNYFFYNKEDKTTKYLNIANELKSNLSKILHIDRPEYVWGDYIVFTYNAGMLLNKYEKYQKQFGDLWADAPDHVREFDKKLLESLHDEDNDILVFAKIKEHFD